MPVKLSKIPYPGFIFNKLPKSFSVLSPVSFRYQIGSYVIQKYNHHLLGYHAFIDHIPLKFNVLPGLLYFKAALVKYDLKAAFNRFIFCLLCSLEIKQAGLYYGKKQYKKYKKGLLTSDGKTGFPTPTGKFEIYSTLLKSYGYEPLPKFIFSKEGEINTPELFQKYPLILNTGARIKSTFRTQHLNITGLLKSQPKPEVLINPDDAKDRGILNGDCVEVFNKRGCVEMYAKVTNKVEKGDLEVNVGGGSPFQNKEWSKANVNYLTDNKNIDEISGFPCFKNLLCDIRKKI